MQPDPPWGENDGGQRDGEPAADQHAAQRYAEARQAERSHGGAEQPARVIGREQQLK
jgi:hypothetical protein